MQHTWTKKVWSELSSRRGAWDSKYKDRHGKNPLLYAIEQGHGDMSEILIRTTRFDINAGIGDRGPVFLAAQSRNVEALEALLKSGDLQLTEPDGTYLLSLAVACGDDRIKALIVQGSEQNWDLSGPPPSPPPSPPTLPTPRNVNYLSLYGLFTLLPEVLSILWWVLAWGPFSSQS
jgi:ankyrin repeat protein